LRRDEGKLFELNELGWWAKWGEVEWVGKDCYVLFSGDFHEPFFNRAGFLALGTDLEPSLDALETKFRERDTAPSFLVKEAREWRHLRELLENRGYKVLDSMSVMQAGRAALRHNPDVEIEIGTRMGGDWSRTYLESFYGRTRLLSVVEKIVAKAGEDQDASFLVARVGGKPVGCASVYRTEGILGAYCIGTIPSFRHKEVGTTVLGAIRRLARREKRTLILQTMLSDSAEPFYMKNGFDRVYLKNVFGKKWGLPRKG
jgi:GNAT superfamily N-acetyltransferase